MSFAFNVRKRRLIAINDEEEQISDQSIPKGVVQEAEAKIKSPGKITTMLSTVYTQNKKAGSPKKNYEYWTEFVEKNFQSLLDLPEKNDGSNDDKDSEDSDDEDNDGATQDDAEQFRACSISLSQVLRDDLPNDIRSLFINTIGDTMEQVSNYTSDFSKQVLKVALLFAEYTFESNDGNIELVYDGGNSIASILPEGYLEKDITVPKPLDPSSLQNDEFNAYF
ncbi:hypothetical protein BD408DRAFT_481819 [Parasitella parasitica]|nr:hypothetical protein BD408DRAFT_481819 [Parasitella parasitica]